MLATTIDKAIVTTTPLRNLRSGIFDSGCMHDMVRWPEVVRRPFGRSQILVIHGIVVGLYYCSDRWKQPIYIIGLLERRTPIPTMH